jgi:pyridoxamine 5'-phosphate oxidase
LNNRQELINSIDKFKEKFNEKDNVPRPDHWSGWNLKPDSIEFWLDGENRIHERLKFLLNSDGSWKKVLLSP